MDYGDCGVGVSKFNLKPAIDRSSYEMHYKNIWHLLGKETVNCFRRNVVKLDCSLSKSLSLGWSWYEVHNPITELQT